MKYKNTSDFKETHEDSRLKTPMNETKRAGKRKRMLLFLVIDGILLLFLTGFLFINSILNKINIEQIDPEEFSSNAVIEEVATVMEEYTNIALFGVDARNNATLDKGVRSDTIMICSINNNTKEIRLVSVYRDSYLIVEGDKVFDKACHAYAYGGVTQAMSMLNKNLDLKLSLYVTVNWKAVADTINILGGIDVEITKREFAGINGLITETVKSTGIGSVHLKSAGMNHLDGVQAVAYARLRLMDSDYRRTERQREVIALAMEKAKKADLPTLLNLVNTVLPQVYTNIDKGQIIDLAKDVTKYQIAETTGFPFDKQSKRMGAKGDCVIPLGLEQNVSQLHAFLFANEAYTPSETLINIDKLLKNATGLGSSGTSGTTTKTTGSTASDTASPPADNETTAQTKTTEGETVTAGETATEIPSDYLETTAPAESSRSTEETTPETLPVDAPNDIITDTSTEDFSPATVEYIPE